MNPENETTAYLKGIESVKLSSNARARMREELAAYADFHTVNKDHAAGVREGGQERSIPYIQRRSVWSVLFGQTRSKHMNAYATLLIALMVTGGGTAAAAQGAVPGDTLYPVKIHVNENVRSAAAIGANAEARLQAALLEERVAEAATLAAEGAFEGETAAYATSRIALQAEVAAEANAHADAAVAADVVARLRAALGEQLATADDARAEGAAAIDAAITTALSVVVSEESLLGTELAGEIDLSVRLDAAAARMEGLRSVVDAETALDAEVRADLLADIDAAAHEVSNARTSLQAHADAQAEASIETADELLGNVESTLSTIGDVTIDASTGAIIDVEVTGDAGSSNEGTEGTGGVLDAAANATGAAAGSIGL